ncbi:MAG TPA: acyltransferase [Acidimicrobiia bacterium]|nr:acyltransferase [Acidimicrobiia bacterium]
MSGIHQGHQRFPCFEGIRAIAALSIIVYHSMFFTSLFFDIWGGSVWANLNAGVWVFFVTSGFLLYLPFAAHHLGKAPAVDTGRYAARRAARIYPAYWVVVAFFTLVIAKAQIFGFDGFLRHFSLTQTYTAEKNPFLVGLPPAWSLVVEVTFYVLLPLYALGVAAGARRSRPIVAEFVGAGLFAGVGVLAIVAVAAGFDPVWMTVFPQHALPFGLGILLAVCVTHDWPAAVAERFAGAGERSWIWWCGALAALLAIPFLAGIDPGERLSSAQIVELNLLQTAIGFCIVVPAALGRQRTRGIRRALQTPVLVYLGVVSYGLYLWHWWVLGIVQHDWLGWDVNSGNWLALLALGLPVVVGAATLSWFVVERPIIGLARRARRRPVPAA